MKHYNPDITRNVIDTINVKGDADFSEVSEEIALTFETNPRIIKPAFIKNASSTTGSTTVYVTPADKDFYLCSATLSIIKDVVADTTNVNLRGTINGTVQEFLHINGITLTAGSGAVTISYPHPIKIDRSAVILFNFARTVGVVSVSASISGFLDEKN